MFSEKVRRFIIKLRGLSDEQRKAILVGVVVFFGLILGSLWLLSTANIVKKFSNETKGTVLPPIDLSELDKLKGLQDEIKPLTQTLPEIASEEVQLETETANWKTYTSKKYGFEIKRPADWFIGGELRSDGSEDIYISPESPKNNMAFIGEALNINVGKVKKGNSLEDEIRARYGKIDVDFTQETTTIGDIDGFVIKTICEGVGCGSQEWVFINNGYFYTLIARGSVSMQLLPTFNVTK